MLRLGSSTEDDPQATPPVMTAPSSHTETTHVPDPSDQEASPAGSHPVGGNRAALEVGAKGQPMSSGPSAGEDRRRGRPEWAARDQVGPAGSEDGGAVMAEEVCARERLKRHRVAMAGRVWIPDTWGQESLLKDWVDCSAVGRALVPSGLVSAREALVEEYRRAEPGNGFRIESSCLST